MAINAARMSGTGAAATAPAPNRPSGAPEKMRADTTDAPASAIITESEFKARIKAHGIRGDRTIIALREYLVRGKPMADAARTADINQSAISRAMVKLNRPVCTECGRERD